MTLDPAGFRNLLGRFASGVTVVTALDDEGLDSGMTVSAFSSVSLEPPLILVCIDHDAAMHSILAGGADFVVNILSAAQEEVARRFAELDGEKFTGIGFTRGTRGIALLDDVLARAECTHVASHEAGDHTIVVGHVASAVVHEGEPLLYYRGGYAGLKRG